MNRRAIEQLARAQALRKRVLSALSAPGADAPLDEYATLLAELVTWDALGNPAADSANYKPAAHSAFTLIRDAGPEGASRANEVAWWLRTSCLAVIADAPQEAKKLLDSAELSVKDKPQTQWLDFTREMVWTSWLGLVRQRSLLDVESAQEAITRLRTLQRTHEAVFLKSFEDQRRARDAALELMALYFLGTAAEKLSQYLIKGTADGGADIGAQLDMYFDRIMHALDRVLGGADLDIALLLRPAAQNLIDSSLRAGFKGRDFAECEFAWCSWDGNARVLTHDPLARGDYRQKEHPTQKPVAVMQWAIAAAPAGATVLDPFMGSGSTGAACALMGRAFTGIERERKYFDIACERIATAQAQGQMFAPEQPKAEQINLLEGA